MSAQFLIMATGCLSSARIPDFPGLDRFEGATYHTGQWPHEGVDFTGKRVGVIGTGSSAIQSIPIIAEQARELVVFQRTASYSVPAYNAPLDDEEKRAIKADYAGFRARNSLMPTAIGSRLPVPEVSALAVAPDERERVYEQRWEQGGLPFLGAFIDLLFDRNANETAAEFVRAKIREIVKDPDVAERLSPKTVIGCKRLCVDTGYFETFNRANVELVDVSESPIEEITPHGLRVGDREFEFDCIVFATGFDAMTGALLSIDIRGATAGRCATRGPRAAHLSRSRRGRLPEPLHDLRPGQPVGAHQHDRLDRAARELDRRLHRVPARQRASPHRGDARGAGRVGRLRERRRRLHAVPVVQLVVPGRQRARQAARVHAAARLPDVRREVRRRRGQGLRGFPFFFSRPSGPNVSVGTASPSPTRRTSSATRSWPSRSRQPRPNGSASPPASPTRTRAIPPPSPTSRRRCRKPPAAASCSASAGATRRCSTSARSRCRSHGSSRRSPICRPTSPTTRSTATATRAGCNGSIVANSRRFRSTSRCRAPG